MFGFLRYIFYLCKANKAGGRGRSESILRHVPTSGAQKSQKFSGNCFAHYRIFANLHPLILPRIASLIAE